MRRTVTEEELLEARAAPEEFHHAVGYLADKPDGSKLSRKKPVNGFATQYSYIRIEGRTYQITHLQLGRGSYSKAKLAYNQQGDRFALKISTDKNGNLADEEEIERDLGVFQAGAHRQSVTRKGSSYTKYLRLMPYLGKNLINYMAPGWFDANQVLDIVLQCVQEVIDFHTGNKSQLGKPYLHRDIKPNNFVIDRERFKLRLIDFGFAVPKPENVFNHPRILGTRGYMAPEISFGEYSVASDIYALGISILEILEYAGANLSPIATLANRMCSGRSVSRPSLEFVKIALLVYQHPDLSPQELAQLLQEKHCSTVDPELALRIALILFNASDRNTFSEPDNFQELIEYPKIKYLADCVWKYPTLRNYIFSGLYNVHRIDELYFALQNLEARSELNQEIIPILFKYSDFLKLFSLSENDSFDARRLFCEFAANGELELLKRIMVDPKVKYAGFNGDSPLKVAVEMGHAGIVEYLLGEQNPQSSLVKEDPYFLSGLALNFAVDKRDWNMAALLVMAGSGGDKNSQVFLELVKLEELNLIGELFNYDPSLLDKIDRKFSDKTPLMEAAVRGLDKVLRFLLTLGADIDKVDEHGNTALGHALNHQQQDAAIILLRANADPNVLADHDSSPLLICLNAKNFEMVANLLLHGARIEKNSQELFKSYKLEILSAIQDLLQSDELNSPVLRQKALYFLKRMAVVKNSGIEADLFPALFGSAHCFCLFKPAAYQAMQKLSVNFLGAEDEDDVPAANPSFLNVQA